MLDMLLSANMDKAIERLIRCFETRAQALYGEGGAGSIPKATPDG